MLLGKTVALYCEDHMEHTDTLCGQNAEITDIKISGRYVCHYVLKS
jgi:hypothetical protein